MTGAPSERGPVAAGAGEVEQAFAGELRQFRIRLGEIRKIEAKCGCSIAEVCRRLARATYVLSKFEGIEALATGLDFRADDVRETVYQGLVGASMPTGPAFKLVSDEIDSRGWQGLIDNLDTALLVLMGSQETPPPGASGGEAPGEPEAGPAGTPTPPSPPTSDASMASAPRSASARARSTNSPPGSSPPPSKAGTPSTAAKTT